MKVRDSHFLLVLANELQRGSSCLCRRDFYLLFKMVCMNVGGEGEQQPQESARRATAGVDSRAIVSKRPRISAWQREDTAFGRYIENSNIFLFTFNLNFDEGERQHLRFHILSVLQRRGLCIGQCASEECECMHKALHRGDIVLDISMRK